MGGEPDLDGIVRAGNRSYPSNFGKIGDRPAIPELLEYLASRFVESKYSMKGIIREVVLSDAYQRTSNAVPENEKLDGENRFLWRQARRRLPANRCWMQCFPLQVSLSGALEALRKR